MPAKTINIYTDSACLGNPGPGGFGIIIDVDGLEKRHGDGEFQTTNNRMELIAALTAIKTVKSDFPNCENPHGPEIILHTDSKHITQSFNQGWLYSWAEKKSKDPTGQAIVNQGLWEEILEEVKRLNITFHWVQGNNGDPMNEACDRMAKEQAERYKNEKPSWPMEPQEALGSQENQWEYKDSKERVHDEIYNEYITEMKKTVDRDPRARFNRKDEYPTRKSTDPSLGEEQARVEGYEACKEELNKYLYQLESGPPPTFRDYVDGYKDCRNDVLEFIRKMKGDAPPF